MACRTSEVLMAQYVAQQHVDLTAGGVVPVQLRPNVVELRSPVVIERYDEGLYRNLLVRTSGPLGAVVRLHATTPEGSCVGCGGTDHGEAVPAPCPTIALIAHELGLALG
jgi:hypothetical protein